MEDLFKKLGIGLPIIQAGMAGGITTPELVAAVSNAGGLGTIGAGYMGSVELKQMIEQVKELTDRPFAVNLFSVNLETFSTEVEETQQYLNRFRSGLSIDPGSTSIKVNDYLHEKIYIILQENVRVVSTAFGVLSSVLIDRLKQKNITLIGMATNLEEAEQLVEAGYDAVVAQGYEAGGHRGTFNMKKYPNGCNIGLFTLVQELVRFLPVPVIAAGGIHTKKQVDALISLGASGVQLGTRFLVAKEAGTNESYRRALIKAKTEDTVLTKVFSGRPARAIRNEFIRTMEDSGVTIHPFPLQNELTKDIRAAGKEFADSEVQSLWAGQGVGAIQREESVTDILNIVMGSYMTQVQQQEETDAVTEVAATNQVTKHENATDEWVAQADQPSGEVEAKTASAEK
ncbi:nitronate monooxygenase [Ornithinibacillus gellani]|uniref:NAD(P)H-dependent flavin oxidoreductase n=1 Tax=Ornithinibacillus gellani TaxID=2293253 RepID=UPI000F473DF6|nr:nitronate monooxygenase [Ornithinibacillus gellani]TQS72044.1 nitronate monooxygenase [Ornithinibacillus gellani]